MLGPTGHIDSFTRDHLPPVQAMPDFLWAGDEYPALLNVAVELVDRMVARGFGDHMALIGKGQRVSYRELMVWSNRLAHVLVDDMGLVPGNRVLLRAANNPAHVAGWMAIIKAGGVVVNTMPMLRRGELQEIINLGQIRHALCDLRLIDELEACEGLTSVMAFEGALYRLAARKPDVFEAVKTGRDDVAILAVTSGTTGAPKMTMHFHRDLLAVADGYAREVLGITAEDVCIGTSPLAFTFGLGGLVLFPLRFGAAAVLLEDPRADHMIKAIRTHQATICFSVPTAYRTLLAALEEELPSLRLAVSAGETLPPSLYRQWIAQTGVPLLDGIGSTEMLHIFMSNRPDDHGPGRIGRPVQGYEVKIIDDAGQTLPPGEVGLLAVRGPTGCRYLADARQQDYVVQGWNMTGDLFYEDPEGYLHFAGRVDDLIVSAGYNIAAAEVEAALLSHEDVAQCAVVGVPDAARGAIVQAHIVLKPDVEGTEAEAKALQDYVKGVIAPYKYPRSIKFCTDLPRTQTGKIQRFRLKE